MGFGFEMSVTGPDKRTGQPIELILRPYQAGEESHLLPGMSSYLVNRYLGNRFGQTLASEAAHLAKLAADDDVTAWAICLVEDGTARPIGTTDYRRMSIRGIASSGSVIYDRQQWGRGIGSLAHLARTWYGFQVDGLMAIRSSADTNNQRSLGALASVGYRPVGTKYHVGITHGKVVHITELLLVNPDERSWQYFWGDTAIPEVFLAARGVTREALERAAQQVKFL